MPFWLTDVGLLGCSNDPVRLAGAELELVLGQSTKKPLAVSQRRQDQAPWLQCSVSPISTEHVTFTVRGVDFALQQGKVKLAIRKFVSAIVGYAWRGEAMPLGRPGHQSCIFLESRDDFLLTEFGGASHVR